MRKSIKAALFSGLVFPGVGHFSLKRHLRGMAFFAPAMTSLLFQIHYVLNRAGSIASQIESGTVPFDTTSLANLMAEAPSHTELFLLNFTSWVLLVCWLGGIVDSYSLGKVADQEKN
jgi:hypothetical protein